MKAWEGRFKEKTAPLMERFSSSIAVDWRLFPYDIEGSIAYAEMLARIGILDEAEKARISDGSPRSGTRSPAAPSPSGMTSKTFICISSSASSRR